MERNNLDRYKQDLLTVGNYTVQQIPCPYNLIDTWETSMDNVYTKFKEKARQRHRIMTMVYAYYVGELIHLSVTPRDKWLEFVNMKNIQREYHFYLGIIRVYNLFKPNVEQIYRTSHLSYRILLDMKSREYKELVNYYRTIDNLNFDEL